MTVFSPARPAPSPPFFSMLCALALGERGDNALVRHGEGAGRRLHPCSTVGAAHTPPAAFSPAAAHRPRGDLILRQGAERATAAARAFVNDQPVLA